MGGVWTTKPFTNWKRACDRMKDHAKSDIHIQASEAALATQGGSVDIVQQLIKVGMQERMRNRAAVKSLIRCIHFLARQHIAHTTNFSKLVDLVVSYGGEDLKYFMEKTGKNATYTSHIAVVEFVEALGTWIEEALLKRLQQASYYSIMTDLWKRCQYSVAGKKREYQRSTSWRSSIYAKQMQGVCTLL